MKASGILMHLTSLPSPYGIGTMGQAAYDFVDFLAKAGQKYWQILPICPTSYGDSPYQSFSTFASNPYLIDLDMLEEEGYLKKEEYVNIDWESDETHVNFGAMYRKRFPVLRKAVARFVKNPDREFAGFLTKKRNFWLEDYALFMALKDAHDGAPWTEWEEPLKMRDPRAIAAARKQYADDIVFWEVLQFLCAKQWRALKAYANEEGIEIIGDLPIYVSADSVDVWANPDQFQLDENLLPTEVAGCPPDGFSADGQLWGNPLFRWDRMKDDGYSWWIKRIQHVTRIYDVVRIDHFRGFAGYYAIPYGDKTARNGKWKTGPGIDLFRTIEAKCGQQPIIAEDLGFLTEDVHELLDAAGYPGMRVLEFAFDSRDTNDSSIYRPGGFIPHCIAYTGTHDNEPVNGWVNTISEEDFALAKDYLNLTEEEGYNWGMMRGIWSSVADTTIVQAQDVLGLGHDSRMNTPSTTGDNWQWRAKEGDFSDELAARILSKVKMYGRAR